MPSSRHAASCHRRRSLGSSCIYSVLRRPFSCAGWSACGMPPPQPEPRRQHDMVSTSRCVSIPYECSSAVRFYSAAAAGSATRCTLSGALSVLLPGFAKAPSCKQLLLNRVLSCLVFRAARARVCVCVQRRRLVAQCAERLAEYRHLVHAAATGNADEAAARVSQNLDTLEAGQVSAHLNPSPQPHTRRDLIRDDSRHRVCRHIVQPPHLSSR